MYQRSQCALLPELTLSLEAMQEAMHFIYIELYLPRLKLVVHKSSSQVFWLLEENRFSRSHFTVKWFWYRQHRVVCGKTKQLSVRVSAVRL